MLIQPHEQLASKRLRLGWWRMQLWLLVKRNLSKWRPHWAGFSTLEQILVLKCLRSPCDQGSWKGLDLYKMQPLPNCKRKGKSTASRQISNRLLDANAWVGWASKTINDGKILGTLVG